MQNIKKELAPCPFCGHNVIKLSNDYHPKCRGCGAVQDYVTRNDAMKSWNTRASDKRIEQLEKELHLLRSELVNLSENVVYNSLCLQVNDYPESVTAQSKLTDWDNFVSKVKVQLKDNNND